MVAWVVEAAVERRFWDKGLVVLTARRFGLHDVIDRGPVSSAAGFFDQPMNVGDGSRRELALDLTVPFDKLGLADAQLKGDLTYRRSNVTDPTTGLDRKISGVRPINWSARFTKDMSRWKMSWGAEAYSGSRQTYYRFNAVDTFKTRTAVNLFVDWRPRPDIDLHVLAANITDQGRRRIIPAAAILAARPTSRIAKPGLAASSTSACARPSSPDTP
jgi:outer membrane receptor protein involved in Fe transport